MTQFQERIRGVIPALVTPLHENFKVDAESVRRVVRRVVDGLRATVLRSAGSQNS